MHNEYCGPNNDLGCEQTSGKIRVLLIEGVESQAQWLQEQLGDKSDRFECAWEKSYQVALNACLTGHYHVGLVGAQLSDDSDGHAEGTEFIQELRRKECDMPLVYCATSDQLRNWTHSVSEPASLDVLTSEQIRSESFDQYLLGRLKIGRLEQQYREEKEKLSATLNCVKNGVLLIGPTGAIDYLNRAAENLLGVNMAEVVGKPLLEHLRLMDEVYKVDLIDDIVERLEVSDPFSFGPDVLLVSRTGEEFNVECSFTPMFIGGTEGAHGFTITINDITEARKYNDQLRYEATHDRLTGLSNRAEFESAVQEAIEYAQEHQLCHSVLYLDVDQFKVVNDTCGHLAGDELLIQLSEFLKRKMRRRDTLSRLGGDEFGVVLWRCSLESGKEIVSDIMKELEDFRFQWNDKSFLVTFSIGIVVIDERCMTWAEVLSRADSACYVAKEEGRHRFHVADAQDPQTVQRFGEMEWVSELIQGLEEGGFEFAHQEIHSVGDGLPSNKFFEILLRYVDRTGRMHLPENFLPAAERYSVVSMLDRWVVTHVLQWLMEHPEQLDQMDMVCINLSGLTVQDDDSLLFFQDILGSSRVDLRKICFEITETVAVTFLRRANYFISAIKELGCRFALDDFGAGMSSFSYLKHLPVDFIKIDGGFSRNLLKDPVDAALVKSINDVAHIMGKMTIATRCETEAVYNKYLELGVDYVQGYYVGRPAPLSDRQGKLSS